MAKKNAFNKTAKNVFWIAMIFLAAGVVVSAVENKHSRFAEGVTIEIQPLEGGASLINDVDIFTTIERSFGHNLMGIPRGELNVDRIERVLEEDPFIKGADVYVDAEEHIHIAVSQREPILRVIDKNGVNYYLDKEGRKMPLSKHFTARVLVATGNIPPLINDFLVQEKDGVNKLFRLTEFILKDDFLKAFIEQIYRDGDEDFILIPKVGKQKIILGDIDRLEDKFDKLKLFYKEGLPYEGWQKYKTINLKYDGQVVCKKN